MKILMSDFDKTFFYGFEYSDKLRAAVKRWKDAGNIIAISTARSACRMRETALQIGLDCDYYICEHGNVIYDKDWRSVSFSVPDKDELMDIFTRLSQADYSHISVADGLTEYAVGKGEPYERETPVTAEEMYKVTDRPASIHVTMKSKDMLEALCSEINSNEKSTVFAHYWGGKGAFFFRRHNDKATGGYKLLRIVGGRKEDVYAIGDSDGDVPMFREFKGYAMSCASEEVKAEALGCYDTVGDLIDALLAQGE